MNCLKITHILSLLLFIALELPTGKESKYKLKHIKNDHQYYENNLNKENVVLNYQKVNTKDDCEQCVYGENGHIC